MLDEILKDITEALQEKYGEDFVELDAQYNKIYISDEDSSTGYIVEIHHMS